MQVNFSTAQSIENHMEWKFRVDGVNVKGDDGCGLRYSEDSYYVITTGEWSVVIDVNTDEMVRVLKDKGYEVKKRSD